MRQKRILATGLLLGMLLLFIATSRIENPSFLLSLIKAAAEAGIVGGMADWFAVTALFRYPLGIRIPHTAIVPNRKDRIGGSLGRFVERNFLSREVLGAKVQSMNVAERLAEWLQQPESAERLAGHATGALAVMIQALPDEEMEALIERQLADRISETEATPLLADALALVMSGTRRQELLDGTLGLMERLLEDNKEELRERIEQEIPWWIPSPIDDKIYRKIVNGTETAMHEVRLDPEHPIRQRFNELVDLSLEKLKSSPELIARGETLKGELLGSEAMDTFSKRLWQDLKASLLPPTSGGRADLAPAIERAIVRFGETLRRDEALLLRVNDWAERGIVAAAESYRHEVAHLIANTVAQWDPDDTSRKIELQVGKDLQFIRINGTVVGGLVGLLLHAISHLL